MKNKGLVLFWTDLANLVAWGGVIFTGALMKWVLPHGGERRGMGRAAQEGWMGMSRHEWGDVHFWIAAFAVALVVLHLALHAGWIAASTRKHLLGGWRRRGPSVAGAPG